MITAKSFGKLMALFFMLGITGYVAVRISIEIRNEIEETLKEIETE